MAWMTRRATVRLLAGAWLAAARTASGLSIATQTVGDSTWPLAPGAPMSPQRMALIDAFLKDSDGLEKSFEARTHKSDWNMPYRLFRPSTSAKAPLILYLHGSGGLGDDNLKQMQFGDWSSDVCSSDLTRRCQPCSGQKTNCCSSGHPCHGRLLLSLDRKSVV